MYDGPECLTDDPDGSRDTIDEDEDGLTYDVEDAYMSSHSAYRTATLIMTAIRE